MEAVYDNEARISASDSSLSFLSTYAEILMPLLLGDGWYLVDKITSIFQIAELQIWCFQEILKP